MATTPTGSKLKPGTWIRFQIKANGRVLEGYVQESDGARSRVRVGKSPDSPENAWHSLAEIDLLKFQEQ